MKRRRKPVNSAWIHNTYLGFAVMMERQAVIIINSSTATDEAKAVAEKIEQLAAKMGRLLKERKE